MCISSKVCQHQFHKECLLEWLEKSWKNTSCPSCRQDLVDNEQIIAQIAVIIKKLKSNAMEETQENNRNASSNAGANRERSEELNVAIVPNNEEVSNNTTLEVNDVDGIVNTHIDVNIFTSTANINEEEVTDEIYSEIVPNKNVSQCSNCTDNGSSVSCINAKSSNKDTDNLIPCNNISKEKILGDQ